MSTPTQTTTGVSLRSPDRFFIDGDWVAPSTSETIEVVDSSSEETFLQVAAAGPEDMSRAVEAARRAFDEGPWPRMAPAERATYIRAIAAKVRERVPEFSEIWTRQSGTLYTVGQMLIPGVAGQFDQYAHLAETFPFEEEVQTDQDSPIPAGAYGLRVREPVGVVGAIIPWNGPLLLIVIKLGPALAAGCTVVLKASPEAPGEALLLAEIVEEVGLPPGVLNVVTADREVSELLVTDPRVDKISFTGSTAAGRRIGSIVGGRIGRLTLELGGKSPALILDDADIDTAAATLAQTETFITGQACISLTRILVTESRHDEMAEALAAHFSEVKVGDPFDSTVQMGPLATRTQYNRVMGYIAKGVEEGAKLVTGGGRPADLDRGFYVEPTVFSGVDNSFTIAQEEIFGPVLSVIPVRDEEDMVRVANDTIYGLDSTVFTNDVDKARGIARRIRAGTVGQNALRCDTNIGTGGFKQSGLGREGGVEGLMHYLETKAVVLDARPSTGA
jgi:acyl-CoA reductase-like NAD-dependent aldehyde dehydrogenase